MASWWQINCAFTMSSGVWVKRWPAGAEGTSATHPVSGYQVHCGWMRQVICCPNQHRAGTRMEKAQN